jgi:transposase
MLPNSFRPSQTVLAHFCRWRLDGTPRRAHDRLCAQTRAAERFDAEPSAAIIDRQTVRATGVVARGAGLRRRETNC